MRGLFTVLLIGLVILIIITETHGGRNRNKNKKKKKNRERAILYIPEIEPQLMTVKFKAKVKVYPECTDPSKCGHWYYFFYSCCRNHKFAVVELEEETCKDGYFPYPHCIRPKCIDGCPDGETCVLPGQCGVLKECQRSCENGGSCVGVETCECIDGYNGTYCENEECSPPCLNGGSCRAGVCECPKPFLGPACDQVTPADCTPPCLNSGTCVSGKCACAPLFTGPSCAAPITPP